MSRLDDAVRRIIAVKCEMGLFDSDGAIDPAATARVGSAEHRMLARQAVQKSLVVLKNDGNVLPLSKTAKVALAGNSADNSGNQCGGWTITWQGQTGDVDPRRHQRPRGDGSGDRRQQRRVFGRTAAPRPAPPSPSR